MRAAIKAAPRLATLEALAANSVEGARDASKPWLLAPADLQAVKASGVTFVASMLERVIEERAKGNPALADGARREIQAIVGPDLRGIKPGSPEAARIKEVLVAKGMWSQYLEVGIGPDAELFSKCPPMAAVGLGARVGVHPASVWSNPEPELVLVINREGAIVAITLGNDVNLRDVEGRSALLLGRAKDNNASCAMGPFFRLLDERFTLDARPARHLRDGGPGPGRLPDLPHDPGRRDQPRPDRAGRPGHRPVPPLPGRPRALHRHHVRAGGRPRRAGQRLHPQDGRRRQSSTRPRSGAWSTRSWLATRPSRGPSGRAP